MANAIPSALAMADVSSSEAQPPQRHANLRHGIFCDHSVKSFIRGQLTMNLWTLQPALHRSNR